MASDDVVGLGDPEVALLWEAYFARAHYPMTHDRDVSSRLAERDELPDPRGDVRPDDATELGELPRFRMLYLPAGPVSLVRGCFHEGCEPCTGFDGAAAFCRYATGLERAD